jgi:hypothetical protein
MSTENRRFIRRVPLHLRALRFAVRGQARRLIYKLEKDAVVLFSFGPRQGIYK